MLGRRIVRRVLHPGPFYATTGYFRMIYRGGQVTAEADSAGTLTLGYTWGLGPDDLVGIRDYGASQHYYVVQDGLRTVRALSRRDGTWTAAFRHRAYGPALDSAGSVPFALRYRWIGREFDEETGLYYLRARYYDPKSQRFTQEDPIGFGGGANVYAYGNGNPTNGRDLNGLAKDYEYTALTSADPNNPFAGGCMGTWDGCGGGSSALDSWIAEAELMYLEHLARSVTYEDYLKGYEARVAGGAYTNQPTSTEALSEAAFNIVQGAIIRLLDLRPQALSRPDNALAVAALIGMLASGRIGSVPSTLAIGGGAAQALYNNANGSMVLSPTFYTDGAHQPFLLAHEIAHIIYRHQIGFQGNEVAADHFAVRATGQRTCGYSYSNCGSYAP